MSRSTSSQSPSPPRSYHSSTPSRLSSLPSPTHSRETSEDYEEEADMSHSSNGSSPTDEGFGSDHDDKPMSASSHSPSPPSPSQKNGTIPLPKSNTSMHPYPRASTPPVTSTSRQVRPRGLAPLSSLATTPTPSPAGSGVLSKSQPLSRTLFARMANDVSHAGLGMRGKKKSGSAQKLIVPTKGFRTTFELDLTASELRRA